MSFIGFYPALTTPAALPSGITASTFPLFNPTAYTGDREVEAWGATGGARGTDIVLGSFGGIFVIVLFGEVGLLPGQSAWSQ